MCAYVCMHAFTVKEAFSIYQYVCMPIYVCVSISLSVCLSVCVLHCLNICTQNEICLH